MGRRHAVSGTSNLAHRLLLGLLGITLCWPTHVSAQTHTGTLQGTVEGALARETVGAPQRTPLAYAVVSIPEISLERFSDGNGRFLLTGLAPGEHAVVVRRIGYEPFRTTVRIVGDSTSRLDVRLASLPVRLAALAVRAPTRCDAPGLPDARTEPAVAGLVALLDENAARYRLLSSQYPFQYMHTRALALIDDEAQPDATATVQVVDSVSSHSSARVAYAAGKIVQQQRFLGGAVEYSMVLPTILDLTDDGFARAHCFFYGGHEAVDGETWLRLEVRAADRLRSPDVHGTFYLDSASSQLRRMDLELSRVDRLPKQLRDIAGVSVQTRFVEIAPGVSIIGAICAVNRPKQGPTAAVVPLPVELQELRWYVFKEDPPLGIPPVRILGTPDWRAKTTLSRAALWCVES